MEREREGEKRKSREEGRCMEKRGKTHPLYCISDFVTRVSSAAIPDRYSLSFNDRICVCVYLCMQTCRVKIRNIRGQRNNPRKVLSRTYPREKRQTRNAAGLLNFRDAFRLFIIFFFFETNF